MTAGHPHERPQNEKVEQMPPEFARLVTAIEKAKPELPENSRKEIENWLAQLGLRIIARKRKMAIVEEALSGLRLDIKYLIFDLEATRRERDEARAMLGE